MKPLTQVLDRFADLLGLQQSWNYGGAPVSTSRCSQFPWIAVVGPRIGGDFNPMFGATLIHSEWILTSPHTCISPGLEVLVGQCDLDVKPANATIIAKQPICHPSLDLLLARLNQPHKNPIRLIGKGSPLEKPGMPVTTLGWGRRGLLGAPRQLHEVELEIQDPVRGCTCPIRPQGLMPEEFCASAPDKAVCKGDSGGPLATYDQQAQEWVLVGTLLATCGLKCAEGGAPAIAKKISACLPWIYQHIPDLRP